MKIYDPEFLGLQVSKMMGNEAIVFCPYHSDSNPSAEFNMTKGLFYCFGCQERKTARELAEDLGGELVALAAIPGDDSEADLRFEKGETTWFNVLNNPLAHGNTYLTNRMVPSEQITKHSIRQNDDGVIFPIKSKGGHYIGAQIRHYCRKPKYLFYGKRSPVWPMVNVSVPGPMFVVEGVFGVLRAERIVNQSTIAMMGAGSVKHVGQFLNRVGGTIQPIAIMDDDSAGLLAAGKFVLMGIPTILNPFKIENFQPDDWELIHWEHIGEKFSKLLTWEVEDVIERSKDPLKLRSTLKKFWRSL
jgi:DNA primase